LVLVALEELVTVVVTEATEHGCKSNNQERVLEDIPARAEIV
jgi:hypothetical protein